MWQTTDSKEENKKGGDRNSIKKRMRTERATRQQSGDIYWRSKEPHTLQNFRDYFNPAAQNTDGPVKDDHDIHYILLMDSTPDSPKTPQTFPTKLRKRRWDCYSLLLEKFTKTWGQYQLPSETSTPPQAVPGQFWLPFSTAILQIFSVLLQTPPIYLLSISADNAVHITKKIKSPFRSNCLTFHHHSQTLSRIQTFTSFAL